MIPEWTIQARADMLRKNLTNLDIADATGYDPAYISQIFKGRYEKNGGNLKARKNILDAIEKAPCMSSRMRNHRKPITE